jgi:hypothetical protein
VISGELYKRGASEILQRCIPIPEGRELIWDIHAGVCGQHVAPCTLVGNAFRKGFYWPTAVADKVVRTCEGCLSMPARCTFRLTPSRPYPLRVHSPCGG